MFTKFNAYVVQMTLRQWWYSVPASLRFATFHMILSGLVVSYFLNIFAFTKLGLPLEYGYFFAASYGFWMLVLQFPAIYLNALIDAPSTQSELAVLCTAWNIYISGDNYLFYLLCLVLIIMICCIIIVRGLIRFASSSNKFDRYFSRFLLLSLPIITFCFVFMLATSLAVTLDAEHLSPGEGGSKKTPGLFSPDEGGPSPGIIQRVNKSLLQAWGSWIDGGSTTPVTGVARILESDRQLAKENAQRCISLQQHLSNLARYGDYAGIRDTHIAEGQLQECLRTTGAIQEHNSANAEHAHRINHSRPTDGFSKAMGESAGRHFGERLSVAILGSSENTGREPVDTGPASPRSCLTKV
jgi:hypothetical protein